MAGRVLGVIAIILFLVAGLVATERFFSPTFKGCIAKQHAKDSANSTKENPSGFLSPAGTYIECTGDFIDKNNGPITALATIVIAAFTATLWRATTRQSDLTREALIADKQAFIFAESFNGYWEIDAAGHHNWRFRPLWKNSGDTSTRNLEIRTNCELRNSPIPSDFPFTRNDLPGTGFIGPKGSAAGGVAPFPGAAISAQDLVDVQAGRKFLYLWGWARYNDVFPDTPKHVTNFCWALIPFGDPMKYVPGMKPEEFRFDHILNTFGNFTLDE